MGGCVVIVITDFGLLREHEKVIQEYIKQKGSEDQTLWHYSDSFSPWVTRWRGKKESVTRSFYTEKGLRFRDRRIKLYTKMKQEES